MPPSRAALHVALTPQWGSINGVQIRTDVRELLTEVTPGRIHPINWKPRSFGVAHLVSPGAPPKTSQKGSEIPARRASADSRGVLSESAQGRSPLRGSA